MIFKQLFEIVNEQKVQTRRLVKPGEAWTKALSVVVIGKNAGHVTELAPNHYNGRVQNIYSVYSGDRLKWQVGRDYAVKSSMYSKSVLWQPDNLWYSTSADNDERGNLCEMHRFIRLRIRITGIRQEPLQDISEEDAVKEGFKYIGYDSPMYRTYHTSALKYEYFNTALDGYKHLWDFINTRKGTRFADNPSVWVINFEVVK